MQQPEKLFRSHQKSQEVAPAAFLKANGSNISHSQKFEYIHHQTPQYKNHRSLLWVSFICHLVECQPLLATFFTIKIQILT